MDKNNEVNISSILNSRTATPTSEIFIDGTRPVDNKVDNIPIGEAVVGNSPMPKKRIQIDPSMFKKKNNNEENNAPKDIRDKITDKAFGDLASAIDRKNNEFKEAMEYLQEASDRNKQLLDDGVIQEPTNTIYYTAEQAKEAGLDKNGNYIPKVKTKEELDDEFEKELEEGLDNELSVESEEKQVKVANATDILFNNTVVEEEPVTEQPLIPEEPKKEELVEEEKVEVVMEDQKHEPEVVEEKKDVSETIQSRDTSIFNNNIKIKSVNEVDESLTSDINKIDRQDMTIDPSDFSDVDDISEEEQKVVETTSDDLQNKMVEKFRAEVLEKVVGSASKLNITSFKVVKKVASLKEALKGNDGLTDTNKNIATWGLLNTKRAYMSSSLTGPELVILASSDEDNNSPYVTNTRQLQVIYNHDENPYKPKTFEGWCKSIPYKDVDEIFMAVYMATYNNGNFIPFTCANEKCRNMELKDIKDIKERMVKFKNDKIKKEFEEIIKTPLTADISNGYEAVITPINNRIAIGFKLPSIYNMLVELRSVSDSFLEKYAAIVTFATYMDDIYMIDNDAGELRPIEYKKFPGDVSKTFRSKIATYSRVLNTFNPDEFNMITAYINKINGANDDAIKYVIPEEKCSKCGSTIEEIEVSGKYLVFIRQRLVDFATISRE